MLIGGGELPIDGPPIGRAPGGGPPSMNIVRACAPMLPGCDALCDRAGANEGVACVAAIGLTGATGEELGEFDRAAFCAADCSRSLLSSSLPP